MFNKKLPKLPLIYIWKKYAAVRFIANKFTRNNLKINLKWREINLLHPDKKLGYFFITKKFLQGKLTIECFPDNRSQRQLPD